MKNPSCGEFHFSGGRRRFLSDFQIVVTPGKKEGLGRTTAAKEDGMANRQMEEEEEGGGGALPGIPDCRHWLHSKGL